MQREGGLLDQVDRGSQVYFTHSYVAPVTSETTAITEHGGAFAAVVQRGPIGGVQFHPETSGDGGLRLLAARLGSAGGDGEDQQHLIRGAESTVAYQV